MFSLFSHGHSQAKNDHPTWANRCGTHCVNVPNLLRTFEETDRTTRLCTPFLFCIIVELLLTFAAIAPPFACSLYSASAVNF